MKEDAVQTFKNINGPTRENLEEILALFRWKYVKPQLMATRKHKFQKLVFNPANQKFHAIIEQLVYAKMPPHLKESINQAHLETGRYEQIVTHPERQLELNGLEAPDELQISAVSQHATNTNADSPKPLCHHCKKSGHYRNQCHLLKKQREQAENNQIIIFWIIESSLSFEYALDTKRNNFPLRCHNYILCVEKKIFSKIPFENFQKML